MNMVRKIVLARCKLAGFLTYADALQDFVETCYWEAFNNYIEKIIEESSQNQGSVR